MLIVLFRLTQVNMTVEKQINIFVELGIYPWKFNWLDIRSF